MKSLADLITEELSEDLRWREQELALMRKQLVTSATGSLQEKVFLRANLAMIYAHYEGFCKFALEIYLDALDRLKLKRKDLKWPLATYSLGKLHKELLAEKDKTSFFSHMLNEFDRHLDEVAEYERPGQIANLWPDLLEKWLVRLNLGADYVSRERTLLESLVNSRNQIAHGKKLMVSSRSELDKYANAATLAMHEVAIGIADSLETKAYLRYSKVNTILGHAV